MRSKTKPAPKPVAVPKNTESAESGPFEVTATLEERRSIEYLHLCAEILNNDRCSGSPFESFFISLIQDYGRGRKVGESVTPEKVRERLDGDYGFQWEFDCMVDDVAHFMERYSEVVRVAEDRRVREAV